MDMSSEQPNSSGTKRRAMSRALFSSSEVKVFSVTRLILTAWESRNKLIPDTMAVLNEGIVWICFKNSVIDKLFYLRGKNLLCLGGGDLFDDFAALKDYAVVGGARYAYVAVLCLARPVDDTAHHSHL